MHQGVWDVAIIRYIPIQSRVCLFKCVQLKEREARGYDIDDRVADAQSTIFYYCRRTLLKGISYIVAPPDVYRSYLHLTWRDTHSVSDSIYYTRKTSIRYFIYVLFGVIFSLKNRKNVEQEDEAVAFLDSSYTVEAGARKWLGSECKMMNLAMMIFFCYKNTAKWSA